MNIICMVSAVTFPPFEHSRQHSHNGVPPAVFVGRLSIAAALGAGMDAKRALRESNHPDKRLALLLEVCYIASHCVMCWLYGFSILMRW